MKNYNFENLRNVGLIGHGATGKTSLAEALLYYTGTTDRLGKNEDPRGAPYYYRCHDACNGWHQTM